MRLLEKKPDDRPVSASSVVATLQAIERNEQEKTDSPTPTLKTTTRFPATFPRQTDMTKAKRVKSSRIPYLGIATSILAASVVGIYFLIRMLGDSDPDPNKKYPDTTKEIASRRSLRFDGRSSYVAVPTFRFEKLPITLEAWLTMDKAIPRAQHICLLGKPGGGIGISKDGAIGAGMLCGSSWVEAHGGKIEPQQRTHVAAVIGTQRIELFINGQDHGKQDGDLSNVSALTPPLVIGKHQTEDSPEYFAGTLERLRISDTKRYAKSFEPENDWQVDSHTLLLYKFDEMKGDEILDSSPHQHHGKSHNTQWFDP
jgi:hypothetical protein